MKKLLVVFLTLCTIPFSSSAQNDVKKFVLIEHFTNTECTICANRNETFYELINRNKYEGDLHHVAYHPPFPSTSCVFYNSNPTDNQARADYYNLNTAPEARLLGVRPGGGGLLSESALEAAVGQRSPLEVRVVETGNVFRTAEVFLTSYDELPEANYKVFVLVVEKEINYNAPNGETMHFDVFRRFLTSPDGDDFTPPAVGSTTMLNFGFPIDFEWFESQIYVLAFVQNDDTKEVINSGTKFDDLSTSLFNVAATQDLQTSPNPVTNQLFVNLGEPLENNAVLQIIDTKGQLVLNQDLASGVQQATVPTSNLPHGVFFVQVTCEDKIWAGKIVK